MFSQEGKRGVCVSFTLHLYSRLTQGRHDIRRQFCSAEKTSVNTLFSIMFSDGFPKRVNAVFE